MIYKYGSERYFGTDGASYSWSKGKVKDLPRPEKRGFVEEDNVPGNVALVKLVNRERHD